MWWVGGGGSVGPILKARIRSKPGPSGTKKVCSLLDINQSISIPQQSHFKHPALPLINFLNLCYSVFTARSLFSPDQNNSSDSNTQQACIQHAVSIHTASKLLLNLLQAHIKHAPSRHQVDTKQTPSRHQTSQIYFQNCRFMDLWIYSHNNVQSINLHKSVTSKGHF